MLAVVPEFLSRAVMGNPYRSEVIKLYKTLLYMGREYPLGYPYFRERCHRAFSKNKGEKDPEKIKKLVGHGEFVVKEIEALYYLKKYRTLKRRYYPEEKTGKEIQSRMNIIEEYAKKD